MIKRIFKSILWVSLLTLFCSMLIIMSALYRYFDNQIMKELQNEANYVSTSVEMLGNAYFENLKFQYNFSYFDKTYSLKTSPLCS